MASKHVAFIAIGSNVGDRVQNCRKAIAALAASQGCHVEECSPLYETEPVGLEDQRWFINGVVKIQTTLEPEELFGQLTAIEKAMGRKRGGARFGPRILDMDIIFYGDRVLRSDKLKIPHPRAHERRFVLQPLCDLDSGCVHPVEGKTVQTLLALLTDGKKVEVVS